MTNNMLTPAELTPIEITNETEDINCEEVVTFLRFFKSYHPGHHLFDEAQIVFDIYQEKIINDYTDIELADKYGICFESIWSARHAMQRAIGVTCDIDNFLANNTLSENEIRIISIYRAFRSLPQYLDNEIEARNELGVLLIENPCFVELLYYLSSGRSLSEYVNEFFVLGVDQESIYKINQAIINSITYGKKLTRSPHQIIAKRAFSNLIKNNTDLFGNNAYDQLYYPIAKVLKYPANVRGEVARSLSSVRKFLELAILVHSSTQNEPIIIDPLTYYLDYKRKKEIPLGIKIILDSYINSRLPSEIYPILSKQTLYNKSTLERYFKRGLYFLENILLNPSQMSLSYEEMVRNRRSEIDEIMLLMLKDDVSS